MLIVAIVGYVILGRGLLLGSDTVQKPQSSLTHSCPCEEGLRQKAAATMSTGAGGFGIEGSLVWGGSVIRGHKGEYHIFASRWDEVLGHPAWVVSSEIVHGVSSSPLGPFRLRGVALPRRGPTHWDGMATHNPTIHWDATNKQYVLFYIGMTYSFAPPIAKFSNRTEYHIAWNSKRIGVATSPSLDGPWRRLDAPILTPRPGKWDAGITSNPSAHLFHNGSVLLLYKSIAYAYPERSLHPKVGFHIGAARALSAVGPYERIGGGPILNWSTAGGIKDKPLVAEDPFVWVCEATMRIHLIFKAMAFIFRDDGTVIRSGQLAYTHTWKTPWTSGTWKWAQPTRIFNDTLSPADGAAFELLANEKDGEAASERAAWGKVRASARNARANCRATKRAANLRGLLKKKKDASAIRDAKAFDEAHDSVEEARDYEEYEEVGDSRKPLITSKITLQRLERPQLLFSVDGKKEPTHAYLAAYHNGFSMNLAVPLGSSPSARRMPNPGYLWAFKEWLTRRWLPRDAILPQSVLATRNST